jgi:Ni2+-binding GTPase involved in maturation of urease and hydrogenase
MTVHFVGGFLGSGKTTAILGAARVLSDRGTSVGMIMNDQGSRLVDAEAAYASGFAASEVTGGCFCCRFSDLEKALVAMAEEARPQVIFAEPVGSCTDLIATVLKPLATGAGPSGRPMAFAVGPLSVFTDIRFLRQRLFNRPLPFGRDVLYVFDRQIEEAQILVLNKSDLLAADVVSEVAARAREQFPQKTILAQSALDPFALGRWVDTLAGLESSALARSIPLDYKRYARGEAALAWYDGSFGIDVPSDGGPRMVRAIIDELRRSVFAGRRPVGHLKIHVRHDGGSMRASITEQAVDPAAAAAVSGKRLEVTINARAEDRAEQLKAAVREGLARAVAVCSAACQLLGEEAFHPGEPRPTFRMQ